MKQSDEPIILSLLDIDFYKLTMAGFVFGYYPDVEVVYGLRNRTTTVRLADHVSVEDLRRELDHVRTLRFRTQEIIYLRGLRAYGKQMFSEDYLDSLENLQMPEYSLEVTDEGQFDLRFKGLWKEAIYWETIALAIINELYFRARLAKMSQFERESLYARGILNLREKIKLLRDQPEITFCDFGTRRRFSREWQMHVNEVLKSELKSEQFLGTSNTEMAMLLDLLPMGTSAHEMYMVLAALAKDDDVALRASHNLLLTQWWAQYDKPLSIALTDTFGSEFFFHDMTKDQANRWKGLRQDSGDPFEFGERAIKFYENLGIDPKDKLIVFSDGLEVSVIRKLFAMFRGRFIPTFGWGTNLTNDLGPRTLSLVIKVIEADGFPTVKLSDNTAKAMGPPDQIKRYVKVFGHDGSSYTECKY